MSSTNPGPPRPQRPGRLVSLLLDLSTREAEVRHVEAVGEHFRLVTLAGEGLRGAAWTPGDMVQIILSGATLFGPWELRSYTPLAYEPDTGTTQILGYIHGHGPGSDWIAAANVGTRCRLVGPRYALSLRKAERPAVFFGDETSFSTAVALRETPSGYRGVRFVFEVDSVEDARAVVERFGMGDAVELVAREEGDRHLDELERAVLDTYRSTEATRGILTGKAPSIQRLYKALRAVGVPGRRLTNVAYWAPGKKGL
ncbi:siderophore-interacting protein [Polyangium sp. y55x31]|uniref:siderophore-interacting protein n=1 Tax=Polyangium sp. y55x31 TaxID=3042688 RepID=UPI002482118B|nr:siderophore-interacting protein [Polyangium sp. y55x31]MDI1484836.1 siderophore-interacting protein [Polyangium sp. y55x31]